MNEACARRLHDINLDIIPTTISHDTTDWHELSRYVLEDVLTCPVGCCLIVCICVGANRNPTKRLYLDQAKQFADKRKELNISSEFWQMPGDHFVVMQGTINCATLFDELALGLLANLK